MQLNVITDEVQVEISNVFFLLSKTTKLKLTFATIYNMASFDNKANMNFI